MKLDKEKRRLRILRVIDGLICAAAIAGVVAAAVLLAVRATAAELDEPAVKTWTDADAEMIAKTVWCEAYGCSESQHAAVIWCILNRVDSPAFPDTIREVVTQPGQFFGYRPGNPADPEIVEMARYMLLQWAVEDMMPADDRVLPPEYLYFSGDGTRNTFTTEYMGGEALTP